MDNIIIIVSRYESTRNQTREKVETYTPVTLIGYARPSGLAIVQGTARTPDSPKFSLVVNNGHGWGILHNLSTLAKAKKAAIEIEKLGIDFRGYNMETHRNMGNEMFVKFRQLQCRLAKELDAETGGSRI